MINKIQDYPHKTTFKTLAPRERGAEGCTQAVAHREQSSALISPELGVLPARVPVTSRVLSHHGPWLPPAATWASSGASRDSASGARPKQVTLRPTPPDSLGPQGL